MSIGCRAVVVLSVLSGCSVFEKSHPPDNLPDATNAPLPDARVIDGFPQTDAPAVSLDPVVLAEHQSEPLSLTTAGGRVYWTTGDGKVQSVPVGGGPMTTHATGQTGPRSVIVDGGNLYWLTGSSVGQVMTAPVAGGEPRVLADMQRAPQQIVARAGQLYWTNAGGDGTVATMPVGGGDVTLLAIRQGSPGPIAADADTLYWSSFGQAEVREQPRINGLEHQKAIAAGSAASLFVVDRTVFWSGAELEGGGHIFQIKPGEESEVLASSDAAFAVVADEHHVYWTDVLSGQVLRVTRAGGPPEVVGMNLHNPLQLAIDDRNVYWIDSVVDGKLFKRAK